MEAAEVVRDDFRRASVRGAVRNLEAIVAHALNERDLGIQNTVPLRQAIGSLLITCEVIASANVRSLRQQLAERDALFERMWAADQRGIHLWRAADPEARELMWPDRAEMVRWLLEQLAAAREEGERVSIDRDAPWCGLPRLLYRAVMDATSRAVLACMQQRRESVPTEAWVIDYAGILVAAVEEAQRIERSECRVCGEPMGGETANYHPGSGRWAHLGCVDESGRDLPATPTQPQRGEGEELC